MESKDTPVTATREVRQEDPGRVVMQTDLTTAHEISRPSDDVEQSAGNRFAFLRRKWSRRSLYLAWLGIMLMGAVISLDQQTVYSYQPYATSDFSAASLLGTIGTIQNILYAVAKPPIAKIADVFGRFEAFATGVFLVTLGFIMLATSQNLATYAAAQIFFVAGQITLQFMIQVYAADSSDLQNRAILNALPYLPFLVTTWVGGYIVEAVLAHSTWRFGYGMYAFLLPAGSIPLLTILWRNQRKLGAAFQNDSSGVPISRKNPWMVFRQLDIIGLVILTAGLTLFLLPFTLAASSPGSWGSAHIIAMLVIGILLLAVFPFWEMKGAEHPMLSFYLLKDRTILGACGVAIFEYIAFYIYQPYFYSYLIVARDQGVRSATNVGVVYPFATTLMQLLYAFIVKYYGRYKWVVMSGVLVKCLAGGLMLKYRSADSTMAQLIISQALLGGGMGGINSIQVAVQAVASPQDMASVTALLFAIESGAGAVGDAISGSLWTNLLPKRLAENLPASAQSDISAIKNSVVIAQSYAVGTAERAGIAKSYDQVMRTMLIVNMVILFVPIGFTLMMRDIDLRAEDGVRDYDGDMVFGKANKNETKSEHFIELSKSEKTDRRNDNR